MRTTAQYPFIVFEGDDLQEALIDIHEIVSRHNATMKHRKKRDQVAFDNTYPMMSALFALINELNIKRMRRDRTHGDHPGKH